MTACLRHRQGWYQDPKILLQKNRDIYSPIPDEAFNVHVSTLHVLLSQDCSDNDNKEDRDYEYVKNGKD